MVKAQAFKIYTLYENFIYMKIGQLVTNWHKINLSYWNLSKNSLDGGGFHPLMLACMHSLSTLKMLWLYGVYKRVNVYVMWLNVYVIPRLVQQGSHMCNGR